MKKICLFLIAFVACTVVFAQQDAPLRIACAGVAHGHLGGLTQHMNRGDYQVVAAWEENDKYRADNILAKRLPKNKFYTNLEEMLDKEKPEAVVAYGSIADHIRVVEACAPRHIHVMVEKPLATNAKDAKRMQELAQKYGIKVMTNYETTWYSANHKAYQLVGEGKIGNIRRINVYDGHEGPKEIGCNQMFLDWLTDPVLNGGGAVVDFGCYGANLATWFMQGAKPKSVYAVLQHNKPNVYPKVDDDATIIVEYPGVTVQIMASWCWATGRKDMYVYGDKAEIYQKNTNTISLNGEQQDTKDIETSMVLDSYLYLKGLIRGTIKEQPHDLSAIENNVTVCEILDAARESAKTGKAVKF